MYSLTPLGEARADSTDFPHNAEEAIPVVMKEHGTLEPNEIANYLNMPEALVERVLHRLEKRGLVTNLNPDERSTSGNERHVSFPKDGSSSHYGEEKSSHVVEKVGSGVGSVLKGLGKGFVNTVKYINRDPEVINRAAIGSTETVFGSRKSRERRRLERMRRILRSKEE